MKIKVGDKFQCSLPYPIEVIEVTRKDVVYKMVLPKDIEHNAKIYSDSLTVFESMLKDYGWDKINWKDDSWRDTMQTSDFKVGQLVQRNYIGKDGQGTWEYAVVVEVFDDRVLFARQHGSYLMWELNDRDSKYHDKEQEVEILIKNEKPVMAKRSIFGGYKFKPRR